MKRSSLFALFILFFLPSLQTVHADLSEFYSNYSGFSDLGLFIDPNTGRSSFTTLLIPFGGLYEGMGTAFTAVSTDIGFLEANPAGSSRLDLTQLSLMHNDWIADTNLESAAFSFRRDNLGFGFGGKFLYVPFTAYNEWGDRDAGAYYSETVLYANASYNMFRSYDFSGLSVGATLKGAYRSVPSSIAPDQSAFAALMDIGLLTRFNFLKPYPSRDKNFSLGAAVRNVGIASLDDNLPSNASLGFAYSPLRPLLISFDYTLPFSLSLPQEEWERPYFAAGASMAFTELFSMHTGFTHRGANPRFSLGGKVDFEEMTLVANYTLDLTTQLSSLDRFSLQASMALGDDGRKQIAMRIDDYYIAGLEAYALGDLQRAVQYWEAVIQLDPDHRPARENMELANRSIELLEEMRRLNTVE
jgi:hypothetical protein